MYCFPLSVHISTEGGGYPHPVPTGGRGVGVTSSFLTGGTLILPHGVAPIMTWDGGTPPSRSDPRSRGNPNWNSIACTCYAAGGMPLALTQEDFLAT